jgi:hypothetical protein
LELIQCHELSRADAHEFSAECFFFQGCTEPHHVDPAPDPISDHFIKKKFRQKIFIINILGARRWHIGMDCNSLSFKQAILNIYPRQAFFFLY